MLEAVAHQLVEVLDLLEEGQPLEGADADVPVAEPRQHRRAGGGGLVVALQLLARLEQREAAAGVHAQRLEHLGRQHLAHAALQRQPARRRSGSTASGPSPWCRGPAAARRVPQLREQEAAPVAELGIVGPELVPVVAQRQRLLEIAGQRLEAAEVRGPVHLRQPTSAAARSFRSAGALGKVCRRTGS
jgi:hypothetical protein